MADAPGLIGVDLAGQSQDVTAISWSATDPAGRRHGGVVIVPAGGPADGLVEALDEVAELTKIWMDETTEITQAEWDDMAETLTEPPKP